MLKTSLILIKMNFIEKLPIPITGVILALVSLGVICSDYHPYLKYIFGFGGCVFLILILTKAIFYSNEIKNDLKNPIILSSSGTFSMSLMLLSTYIINFNPIFAYSIWILGICLHILLMIYFTYNFIIHNFNINDVYPTYWIVFVGITMAAITSHSHNIEEIGFIFFIFGFIAMLITLPLMIYRYINYKNIPTMNRSLICIFTALFSILIVGYSNTSENISITFIMILYCISCLFYIFSLYKLLNYRKLDFYPSFSAFTFPFVISANATKQIFLITKNTIINNLLTVELIISIIIVIYVLVNYLKYLKNS